jgi:CheY-like chemotaxis protein
MLGKLGYRVEPVDSGEDALAWIQQNPADLVILDMVTDPGIDGYETYRRMLELQGTQRAIVTSGFAENDRVRKVQALGARGYVRKPYTLERLTAAIRRELYR